ncbi:unnamed protein product, partial [Didymodactylos carnosus]
PVVWYQKIEYAVQHWLSKAFENTFGCVLCTPGCFSLFRASALLDDNVLKTYSRTAEEAAEMVQYDQGEDRWLCTLLLLCRSGYNVDYCANADAAANSPDTFTEFLNQRRRWIPSSLINHFDFVKNGQNITKHNKNLSIWYIIMQGIIFISNVTGPAFIIIYMPSALTFSGISLSTAYVIIIIPTALHLAICLTCTKDVQIRATAICSLIVALLFTMGLATSIFAILYESSNYANYFIVFITAVTFLAGLLHPLEAGNLFYLILYIVGTPVMFLLFYNYAICNINDVGWGTREQKKDNNKKSKKSYFARFKHIISLWMDKWLNDMELRLKP